VELMPVDTVPPDCAPHAAALARLCVEIEEADHWLKQTEAFAAARELVPEGLMQAARAERERRERDTIP
jgi:hypothetical protein